ncbi:phage baseplate protein [Mannheimia granulomatis]|uniref:Phage baseplate protein n=1 Tax=Mannheimia granulomatis TaxID=85402 RepID=A0A6G8JH67_9PAST|nr:baseplate J/gp47 family protein [Mannheimia granulomatis]QIM66323.1 phage baseplate protein [Mannheimia granulomatis]
MEISSRYDITVVPEDVKQIVAETIAKYEQDTGKVLQPAHIERLIINVYAFRELLVRKGINEAFRQTFPQTATGIALDLCGGQVGCERLENQAARCMLRFSVNGSHSAITIPVGTVVQATDSLSFSTLYEMQIRATEQFVDVEAVANVVGEMGNGWEAGRVSKLVSVLNTDSVVTVSNLDTTSGGIDTEDDDNYRKRILLAPEAFTTCGTAGAYTYHALSVSQFIADVDISTPQGGTVQIAVLTRNGAPSESILRQVQSYVADPKRRTLCDTVQVIPAQEISYQINAELDLLETAQEQAVLANAEQALRTYLSARTQKLGLDIVPLDIQAALKVVGVYNVRLLQPPLTEVNNQQWANCQKITLSVSETRKYG